MPPVLRSWPTKIAGQRFTERLCYDGPVEGLDTSRPHRYRWNGTVAAYAWQGDTLSMRMDWLDGGDNRRLKIIPEGAHITVIANDNFDPLLTDTIRGEIVEID